MALIKCPECGKENVSESAGSCPSCGYGIKSHFENEKIQMQKEFEIQEQQQILAQENQRKEKALELEKLNKEKRIEAIVADGIEVPKIKPFINSFLLLGIIFAVMDFFMILIALGIIEGDGQGISFFWILLFSFFPIAMLLAGYSTLEDSRKLYDEHSHNQEEYKKALAAKILCEIETQDAKKIEKQKAIQNANNFSTDTGGNLKCPKCGSTQIQMMNRRWTVGTGFLNNKIDRVCMKCKNKF